MESEYKRCYLCGELIHNNPNDADLKLSRDHVPQKQFYPKEIRKRISLNLEHAPSHKRCNESYREDEEYFYHAFSPLVKDNNPKMGNVIFQDFKRRSKNPQTPAMIRKICKDTSTVTQGGIHLPAGIIEWSLDEVRLQRIAMKIARGVLTFNDVAYIPESNCKDIRMHQDDSEVIDIYKLSWQASPEPHGVCHKIFSYRYCSFDNQHLITLLFWESLMYCLCFDEISSI